jgi:hypothetical protein
LQPVVGRVVNGFRWRADAGAGLASHFHRDALALRGDALLAGVGKVQCRATVTRHERVAHRTVEITAGQRVQIMKRVDGEAVIQFGTEVVAGADGTIAGLLGASPGASTAVPIMLDVLAKCFPDRIDSWEPELERMIPSYGGPLSANKSTARATISRTAKALQISA